MIAITPSEVTAVIAAGGRSSRFGQDKAGFPIGSSTMVERTIQTARRVSERVLIALPPEKPAEPKAWKSLRLTHEIVTDSPPGVGPIGALCAGLEACSGDWLLLLACDLPNLRPESLVGLLKTSPTDEYVSATRDNEHFEPMVAVYHRNTLPKVHRQIEKEQFGLNVLLQSLKGRMVTFPARELLNVNRPGDVPEGCL